MRKIPIGIEDITLSTVNDKAVIAMFTYRAPRSKIETAHETVKFDKTYPFSKIVGAEFAESEIDQWVKAHKGQWDANGFLFDKIVEFGGAI